MMIYVMCHTCQVSAFAVQSLFRLVFSYLCCKVFICVLRRFLTVDKSGMSACRTL